jgi:hypothetical protein
MVNLGLFPVFFLGSIKRRFDSGEDSFWEKKNCGLLGSESLVLDARVSYVVMLVYAIYDVDPGWVAFIVLSICLIIGVVFVCCLG